MKNGKVIKSAQTDIQAEMTLINSYSRRELKPEEVYIFSVALCDNDIDRDNERFTVEALFALEKLFVGKTGIIDHDPTAKNQKARIISCRVENVEGEKTALGDDLFRLTARAYIRRSEGNAELIEAIEAGIVKEVSVGCSVGGTVCSICRQDMRSPACGHIKGREYDGELCYGELSEPTDAYEFSFVAVPAQRAAGVIKSGHPEKEKKMKDITKLLDCERLSLEGEDMKALREYISGLKADAECAAAYREELVKRFRDNLDSRGVALSYKTARAVADKLTAAELREFTDALAACEHEKAAPQLCRASADEPVGNTQFRI